MRLATENVAILRLQRPDYYCCPPIGIGYLLKALSGLPGVRPVFIDCHRDKIGISALCSRLRSLSPIAVGVHAFSCDYGAFMRGLSGIRAACPNALIVIGGPHASALPAHVLEHNHELDVVVKGEGEQALPNLVEGLLGGGLEDRLEDIPNLAFRREGRVVENPVRWIDVTRYGAPAWDLIQPDTYPAVQHGSFHKSTQVVPVLTSRGCPYPCTFCAGRLVTGRKIRVRAIDDVIDELVFLNRRYGFDEFHIEDENFSFCKERVLEFAAAVDKANLKCHFAFPNGLRMDRVDEETVRTLRDMGAYMATLGIESMSPATLRRMKKSWTRELVEEKLALFNRYGIKTNAAFILGFRDDTMADIRRSVDFALEARIDTAYFGNYIPLPGTEDFNILLKRNDLDLDAIDWDAYSSYHGKVPYHPHEVPAQQLLGAIRSATWRFYSRPRTLLGLFGRLNRAVVFTILRRLARIFSLRGAS